jgi:hypothetical protein
MYFNNFPILRGKFLGEYKGVTDIFRRVGNKFPIKNIVHLETTEIQEGESPELLAYKIYGKEDLHWTLIVVNDIVDVRTEWPLRERDLYKYCLRKYGEENVLQAVHHYRTTDAQVSSGVPAGLIVDYDSVELANGNIEPVTNWNYEQELNDAKKTIKYVPKKFISQFVREFMKLIRE